MMDFTLDAYTELVLMLRKHGYSFQSVRTFTQTPLTRVVILRHDVDLRSYAALRMAETEASLGVESTYYFRVVRQSFDPMVISKVVDMGHEIGYHYEDLAAHRGNYDIAIKSFETNLAQFRIFYPVKTVCMHGSSGSHYDNRDLWKRYKLEDFGLLCEPYLSIDYNRVLYLSDTGRCWDGSRMSLRDKVESPLRYSFHTTQDIISGIHTLPDQILITAHPEQWTDNLPEWLFVKGFSIAHTMYKVHYRNRKIRGKP